MAEGDAAELSAADLEIEEMQRKVQEMEEEAEKLKKLTDAVEEVDEGVDREEIDKRSVYVGSVDYGSTPEELQEHFKSCGQINRITILVDKYTGSPKGFAYIEFSDEQSVQNSLLLNGSLFRGRQLKVIQKRTNVPGWNSKGKGKGKEGAVEETRRDRVQQLLAQRQNAKKGKGGRKGGGPGGDAAGGGQQLTSEELAVLQKITEVNRKCGWSIKYRRVKTFLSLLDHQAQLSTIHSLFKKHQQNPIAEPDRWLEVACATRASKRSGVQKGKGAQKGKPRATGPQLAEGSKVMKRLRFIEKNVELAVPLEIPAVSSKLALLEEEVAMELLKTLAQKAAQLRNANGWLLGAVKKELEARQAPGPAAAPGLAEEWVFEDEDLDEGEA